MDKLNEFYEQAWLYDLVHRKAPDGKQISFFERAIKRFGEPVLELASGTGEYLVTLSEQRFDIKGVEKFSEPIGISREKAERRQVEPQLRAADMRNFSLDEKFRLIFVAGNGLQHLKANVDVLMCFDSVRRHLLPGGKFIVEVFNPSVSLLARDPNDRFMVGEFRTEDGWLVITTSVRYDASTQINHIDWHYRNQYSKDEQTVSFSMRQFFPLELDQLFFAAGFRISEKYGDFDERSFDSDSAKQIIVAEIA